MENKCNTKGRVISDNQFPSLNIDESKIRDHFLNWLNYVEKELELFLEILFDFGMNIKIAVLLSKSI